MKKILTIIILSIYFCVSTGFVVSMHYCMDKFASVELGDANSEKCGKCGMHTKDSDGCCRDEVKVVKLQQDQTQAKMLLVSFAQEAIELPLSVHLNHPFYNFTSQDKDFFIRPPILSSQDTYLNNRVFRI